MTARKESLTLRSGRTLAWTEWGRENARAVLFCTGAGMSGSLGFGQDHLDDLGLRLLSFDRPGLGQSSFDPDKNFTTWASDVAEVVVARGLRDPLVVGFSQGAPFALALAGLAERIAIVSGQDELAHESVKPLVNPQVAGFAEAVRQREPGFWNDFSSKVDADGMWQLIASMSGPKDLSLFASEPFQSQYVNSLREGFSQGSRGYLQDLVLAMSPWAFVVEKVVTPVDLWYGRLDTSPVHSPDFGLSLSQRLPNATLEILDDEGSSILWTRAREILTKLSR